MDKIIKIEKLGESEKPVKEEKPEPKKTRSILKKTSKLNLKGVRDPAKTKHTIRLLTAKGSRRFHKKTMKSLKGLKDEDVIKKNAKSGLVKNKEMPVHLQREVLKHAIHAGFVSL
jgi:hypothetical protein